MTTAIRSRDQRVERRYSVGETAAIIGCRRQVVRGPFGKRRSSSVENGAGVLERISRLLKLVLSIQFPCSRERSMGAGEVQSPRHILGLTFDCSKSVGNHAVACAKGQSVA